MKCFKCKRPALSSVRGGKPKSIKDHDLCQRCYRDQMNAERVK